MRIVNNVISIAKGETSTYDVSVIDKKTGVPFILPKGIQNPAIEFIVRPSIYNRDDDFVFRAYLLRTSDHMFETDEVVDYNDPEDEITAQWDDAVKPVEGDEGKLFRRYLSDGSSDFRYYDENQINEDDATHWIPYEFKINFTFPYEATSLMENKTYKYEVTLFGGVLKDLTQEDVLSPPGEGESIYSKIDFKKPLLEATDFVVGGSLSE